MYMYMAYPIIECSLESVRFGIRPFYINGIGEKAKEEINRC